eukprot:3738031-Karenia_brevis.AAC.1
MEFPQFDKMQDSDSNAMALYETSSVPFSGQEYGNPGQGATDAKMPDSSRVSARTSADGFCQPLGDITNWRRSVPVSVDSSAACS